MTGTRLASAKGCGLKPLFMFSEHDEINFTGLFTVWKVIKFESALIGASLRYNLETRPVG
jgi:hypothetical protein